MAALKVFLFFNFLIVCLADNNYFMPNYSNGFNNGNQPNQNTTGMLGEGKNIERPCEIFDVSCIRRYLAKHSKCNKVHGTVEEPYFRPQTRAYLPNINVTLTLDDVVYKGLNGRIQEFFINRETDKLILAVEFRNLYTASEHTEFRVHRRAREPINTYDYLKVLYSSMTVTIIIPDLKNLILERGESFTYVDDAYPRINVGPRAFNSPDPTVRRAGAEFYTNMPISVREAFVTEGSFLIVTYIQNSLCDFGLKVL